MNVMKIYEFMQERGMNKGSATGFDGSVCIIGACLYSELAELKQFDKISECLDSVAKELYPDRVDAEDTCLRPASAFNDHPDTTLDDIRVVCEKAQLRLDEEV